MDRDTYSFAVEFTRNLADDLAVIGCKDTKSVDYRTRAKLVKQFIKELQAAYLHPDTAIAGSFNVLNLKVNGGVSYRVKPLTNHQEPTHKEIIPTEDVPEKLAQLFQEAMATYGGPKFLVDDVVDDSFDVTIWKDEYVVSVEFDEDESEPKGEPIGNLDNVVVCENHAGILDVCLKALSNNSIWVNRCSDLSTDGDHKDCEAFVFVAGAGWVLIKVRRL